MTIPLGSADPERLGGYEILGRLGSGGQGVVFLARPLTDPGQGPAAIPGSGEARGQVAIKLLHAQMVASPNARARFIRELSLLRRVAGFCTAQVIDADLAGDQPYIVSEYVPGPSLRELVLDQGPRAGAHLDRLAISSVTALTAIHRAGIVHRDFKPQNVLMGSDGPRVIDFGIARALGPEATVASQIVGTPAYMAPEQFAGAEIGPAADLFAWAATMLFAATGRDPFSGGSVPATMYRIMHHDPDLSVLPEQIATVAADALQKDPTARPSAEEALLRLLGDRTSPNRPPPTQVVPPGRPPRRAPSHAPSAGNGDVDLPPTNASSLWQAAQGTPAEPPTEPGGSAPHGGYSQGAEPTRQEAPQPGPDWQGAPPSGQGAGPTWQGGPSFGRGAGSVSEGASATGGAQVGWSRGPGAHDGSYSVEGQGTGRGLRRSVPVAAGLVLAALMAVLDVLSLAILVARPDLTTGSGGASLLVVASSFVGLSIVTLVGVVLAWRGSRTAAWTVLVVRVVRVPLWGVWTLLPDVDYSIPNIAGYAGVTAVMVLLLTAGLRDR